MEEDVFKEMVEDLRFRICEKRKNGMFLSDYQIEVLEKNGFHYEEYSSIKKLLFDIENYLNSTFDMENDSLESVSAMLSEREYYSNINQ